MKLFKTISLITSILLIAVSCDTELLGGSDQPESYLGTLEVLNEDQSQPNLKISTLNLDEDFVLCSDGEAVGVVPRSKVVEIRLDVQSDELKTLWLIPSDKVEDKSDISIENSSYTWVAKIYSQSLVREWKPMGDEADSSTMVTFYPSQMGSQDWDYALGYLDDDDTYAPLAVLTPHDDGGVSAYIDFGRITITWKYYKSSQHDSVSPVLVAEADQEFALTEEDLNKKVEIPMYNQATLPSIELTLKNMESYMIRLYLNGNIIESSMDDPVAGYSNIEAFKSRTYSDLLIDEDNILIVMSDDGEMARTVFSADDGDVLYFEFTEADGLN